MKPTEEHRIDMQMERQMGGCMTGFLQIFDRHQILAGRRGIYAAKRLPFSASPVPSWTSPSERSDSSVSSSPKQVASPPAPQPQVSPAEMRPPSPEPPGWVEVPARPSLPLPVFDFKEGPRSSWKFREAPRLSLDSRVDVRGKVYPREIRTTPARQSEDSDGSNNADRQRRSPSVVARLMGLDALPGNGDCEGAGRETEPYTRAELRRSASESRASRDLLRYQFVDGRCFQLPSSQGNLISEDKHREVRQCIVRDTKPEPLQRGVPLSVCRPPNSPAAFCSLQRKSFFDVQDYFVSEVPKRAGGGSLYGEVEKRLRMRGMDEPAKDLETLKQILEVVQLRGLLHPSQHHRADVPHQPGGRNFVYEQSPTRRNCYESPIVVMQPAPRSPSPRSPPSSVYPRTNASPPPARRSQLASLEPPSRYPRRSHVEIGRNPAKGNNGTPPHGPGTTDPVKARSSLSPAARRRPAPAPQAATSKGRLSTDRRMACGQLRKTCNPQRGGSDPATHSSRNSSRPAATRERFPLGAEVEEFAGSDGNLSGSSQFDFERVKSDYRDGRILLERCDKLLHSIAEITSKAVADDEEHVNAAEQQPSPVSVLDATISFDRDDAAASPTPVLPKRCIDFKDKSVDSLGEERWIAAVPSVKSELGVGSEIDDGDFFYVSEILRASDLRQTAESNLWSPEKPRPKTGDVAAAADSKSLPLHRRLVFDVVSEIVERRSQVSPWEAFLQSKSPVKKRKLLPGEVWTELRRIQEHSPADDLCELICGILRKDITATTAEQAWNDRPAEMSDAVLDIERLIFKDLVADTIRLLAAFSERRRRCSGAAVQPPPSASGTGLPRRRLMF